MNEAQEQLRQERMKTAVKKYGLYVAIFIIGLITIVAVQQSWSAYQNHKSQKQTALLFESLGAPDSLEGFALDHNTPQAVLAGFNAFAAMNDDDKRDKGLTLLKSLSENNNLPDLWRDYASFVYARAIQLYKEGVTANETLEILATITENEESPFYNAAVLESAAIIAVWKKDLSNAQALLNLINGAQLPAGLEQNRRNLQTYIRFADQS